MSQSALATGSKAPPEPLKLDVEDGETDITNVLARKRSFNPFKSTSSGRRKRKDSRVSSTSDNGPGTMPENQLDQHIVDGKPTDEPAPRPALPGDPEDVIAVEEPATLSEQKQDIYRWAVLYENQRGVTLLGMPQYGSRSLLPSDPAHYTLPVSSLKNLTPDEAREAMLTPATLRDYQLPDAKWRWVSKYWMVDMRGDGEVCSNGFEYNWAFRKKGWRPHAGPLSAGGWVRRRRWVRLMMRPADTPHAAHQNTLDSSGSHSPLRGSTPPPSARQTPRSSLALDPDKSFTDLSIGGESALGNTWRGDAEGDWERCRRVLRHFRRDGRKLELWTQWLGLDSDLPHSPSQDYLSAKGKGKAGDIEESDGTSSPLDIADSGCLSRSDSSTPDPIVVPDKEVLLPILRGHGREILSSFLFPESRAKFLQLLSDAGIDKDIVESTSIPDFWSRRSRITELNEDDDEKEAEVAATVPVDDQTDGPTKKLSVGGKEELAVTE